MVEIQNTLCIQSYSNGQPAKSPLNMYISTDFSTEVNFGKKLDPFWCHFSWITYWYFQATILASLSAVTSIECH